MADQQKVQEPGFYPRVNSTLLQTPSYDNLIVSIIGKQLTFANSVLTLETGDKQTTSIHVSPDHESSQSDVIEVIGAVLPEGGGVQCFVTRDLPGLDMDSYNKLVQMENGAYRKLFFQPDYV